MPIVGIAMETLEKMATSESIDVLRAISKDKSPKPTPPHPSDPNPSRPRPCPLEPRPAPVHFMHALTAVDPMPAKQTPPHLVRAVVMEGEG